MELIEKFNKLEDSEVLIVEFNNIALCIDKDDSITLDEDVVKIHINYDDGTYHDSKVKTDEITGFGVMQKREFIMRVMGALK